MLTATYMAFRKGRPLARFIRSIVVVTLVALATSACAIGVISEEEFAQQMFERGGGIAAPRVEQALHDFAQHGGYDDVEKTQLRRISFQGSNFSFVGDVLNAQNPVENDWVFSQPSRKASPRENSTDSYFLAQDIPTIFRKDPATLLRNMRDEVDGAEITGFDLMVRVGNETIVADAQGAAPGGEVQDAPVPQRTENVSLHGTVKGPRIGLVSFEFDPQTGEVISRD